MGHIVSLESGGSSGPGPILQRDIEDEESSYQQVAWNRCQCPTYLQIFIDHFGFIEDNIIMMGKSRRDDNPRCLTLSRPEVVCSLSLISCKLRSHLNHFYQTFKFIILRTIFERAIVDDTVVFFCMSATCYRHN